MKKLSLVAMILAGLASLPAQAGSPVSSNFNVLITLTSACAITTPSNISLSYTAGGSAQTGTTSATVNCTTNLPYTLSMNGIAGAGSYSLTDTSTGLPYTLAFTAAGTGGADVTGTGNGATGQVITIGANIAAGKWGTCNVGSCNNGAGVVQTVYVNY